MASPAARPGPYAGVDDETLAFMAKWVQAGADKAQRAAAGRQFRDTPATIKRRQEKARKLQARADTMRKEIKRRKKERKA